MKATNKKVNLLLGAILSLGMAACGSDDPTADENLNGPYGANDYNGCQIPDGYKDRTVTGSFGNGAYLTLDIFTTGGNTVAAVGILSVPSVESLFGTDTFDSSYDFENPVVGGTGYTGNYSEFRTCVSTEGFNGVIERGGIYENIDMVLRGNGGVYIEMGDAVGFTPAVIVNGGLEGTVKMKLGEWPLNFFTLTRD